MGIDIMNEINLKDVDWKKYFQTQKIVKRKYEAEVLINPEKGGFLFETAEGIVFEKTKGENSVKIFLINTFEKTWLRALMMCFGTEEEKEYFSKGYNKLYFDSMEELEEIVRFMQIKYDAYLFHYFESDEMYKELLEYYKNQKFPVVDNSLESLQKRVIEAMAFSKRVKFSQDGNIYLKE